MRPRASIADSASSRSRRMRTESRVAKAMSSTAAPANAASVSSSSRSSAALFTDITELVVSSVTTAPATSSPLQIGCAADITARPSRVTRARRRRALQRRRDVPPGGEHVLHLAFGKVLGRPGMSQPNETVTSGCHHGASAATSVARRRLRPPR